MQIQTVGKGEELMSDFQTDVLLFISGIMVGFGIVGIGIAVIQLIS